MTDHYDRCRLCHHVFKPKKLTKKQVEDRKYCMCMCHFGSTPSDGGFQSLGITDEEASLLVSNNAPKGTKTK